MTALDRIHELDAKARVSVLTDAERAELSTLIAERREFYASQLHGQRWTFTIVENGRRVGKTLVRRLLMKGH